MTTIAMLLGIREHVHLPTDKWLALITGMSSARINRLTAHDDVTSEYLHLPSMSEPGLVQMQPE
ncbi:MAG: hypothetical protein HQL65_20365 [Magnetococcales bacterium]|nr:hypothetical protein [Magnetococcales bacterium]